MKVGVFLIFLISILGGGLRTISQANEYATRAAAFYKKQQYQEAIVAYEYLQNNLEVNDDKIKLNLAHAYYKSRRFKDALLQYRLLADNPAAHIRSVVHLQLGNIAAKQKKYKQALSLYKQALIAESANEAARYNFELLKKYLDLHPEKTEQPQEQLPELNEQSQEDSTALPLSPQEESQPKRKPDATGDQEEEIDQSQPDENGQQDKGDTSSNPNGSTPQQKEKEQASGNIQGDTKGANRDNQVNADERKQSGSAENATEADVRAQTHRSRLQKAKISPGRAKLLLDAVRNAEMQYIQQLPKRASQKPDKSKPDW